ncbi:ATP synthase F1 subcomplex delta subunit [Abditibacterium utsteinense]|uniref:ATP synthase subunit delta n=1 Tax=Abditibacterium utsteinense TaxID=1960156 RepID=A0A2S8SV93_9BACT|nr:F0F1 ATP synthase subunit delta [Abditibacterium utsteinense]PQV64713.1 ATP synthase F1 subcomplex delta subunit [Abditibacterium utsteinense]
MTGDLSVARRYASALFAVAKKRGEVEIVASNLKEVAETVDGSRQLAGVLHNPLLPREKKRAILHGIFGSVHADVEKFLFLVVEKDRAILLPQIVGEFNRLVDEFRGEADGEVVSAVALSAAQIESLQRSLQARFGVKVRLQARVEPEILGGLIVRVGDKQIDGSVASKLRALSEQLKRVKVA